MNSDVFNELVDALGSVLGSFRSLKTFPADTKVLLEKIPELTVKIKAEYPKPSIEELDALIDLEKRTADFKNNIQTYKTNLVLARTDFVHRVLRFFLSDLNVICSSNPKYAAWLSKLRGFQALQRMTGL